MTERSKKTLSLKQQKGKIMPQDIDAFMGNTSRAKANSGKGFTPTSKTDRPAASPTAPNAVDPSKVTQSEAMAIRESVNLAAGMGAKALQALSGQREQTKETIAAEIERLTDPGLFFAETMTLAADRIRQRQDQIEFELDFYDAAGLQAMLPEVSALPKFKQLKEV
jgi:hypothetical protein